MSPPRLNRLLAILVIAAAASGAFAQPTNDPCSNPDFVTGAGTFPWTNVLATTDGSPDPLCNFNGYSQIDDDVWLSWTAPLTGTFIATTCGVSAADTKLAVYDPSSNCAGGLFVLDCNDDDATCSPQSTVTWSATQGATYLVRVGTNAAQGGGGITFRTAPPPPCPADYNMDGIPDVRDIFAFLADWFAGVPRAFNYGGTPGVPAIFAFLLVWFAGC